jgi:hypothetical protein
MLTSSVSLLVHGCTVHGWMGIEGGFPPVAAQLRGTSPSSAAMSRLQDGIPSTTLSPESRKDSVRTGATGGKSDESVAISAPCTECMNMPCLHEAERFCGAQERAANEAGSHRRPGSRVVSREGDSSTPVLFYGRSNENGYLSQMYDSGFLEEGQRFLNNEQYFQAAKAACFGDDATKALIMRTSSPYAAKALGRAVRPFDAERWNNGRR